jgi:ABC-type multidrug transport system fused ATPase/permease subunit
VLIGHLNDYTGNVLYDQVELKELTDESLGKIAAIIHQNVYMFDETIEQNISLHKAYKNEALELVVEESGVSLFLNDERTLQTKVGENGSNLSGGERQRIAVARALIQNKPLLILDEGTSAIDKQTARDIESRLLFREDLTLLTITHSLDPDLLNRYDEIIYMKDGTIIESGSFADLMESQGKFSQYMQS